MNFGFFAVIPAALAEPADDGVLVDAWKNNVISTSPILDLFTWWNLEYERRVRPDGTIGLAGSFINFDDDEKYMSVNAFYRYYPQGRALSGFFIGGRLGLYGVEEEDEEENDTQTAFGFGIDIAYSWLLGDRESFSISLGVGAVRLFGGDLDEAVTLPTLRVLNIGLAF